MTSLNLLKISITVATLLSLYILVNHIYKKEYHKMNGWQFPMLLAILLELVIYT
jgi:hypothetical protein